MGREFVVKHIRNKHGHVLEVERERLQEEAFWENFRWGGGEQQAVGVRQLCWLCTSVRAVAAGGVYAVAVGQLSVLGELQVRGQPCLLGGLVVLAGVKSRGSLTTH